MHRGILKEHSGTLTLGLYLADWVSIVLASMCAHWIYLDQLLLPRPYIVVVFISILLSGLLFPRLSLYQAWRGASILDEVWSISLAWGAVLLSLMALAFTTKTGAEYSRGWFMIWSVLGWSYLIIGRASLRLLLRWARRHGLNLRHVVVVGEPELSAEVIRRIQAAPWVGLKVIGFFQDADLPTTELPAEMSASHCGGIKDLPAFIEQNDVDQVWIALPLREELKVQSLLHELRHSTVDIRFVPDLFGLRLLNHSVMDVAGLPVMNLSVTPMTGMNRWIKATEDWLLALIILILISPILLTIAIAVKLTSPGPMLFKQKRYGWEGKPITVYKFRSMVVHDEADGKVTQATVSDSRITPLGSFLRRTSLDELPQFYNVLQGRMSIVGPRPHAVAHNELYKDLVDDYMKRHKVKPGITGWAQINGWRGETDTVDKMKRRVEFDLYYIENWSLWFDIKIIFLTLFNGFVHKNAR